MVNAPPEQNPPPDEALKLGLSPTQAAPLQEEIEAIVEEVQVSLEEYLASNPVFAEDFRALESLEGINARELVEQGGVVKTDCEGHIIFLYLSRQSEVRNIQPLSKLSHLRFLYLGFTPLEDVSSLAALDYLEVIDLCNTNVNDISAFAGKQNLRALFLLGCPIPEKMVRDVARTLPSLETLSMPDAKYLMKNHQSEKCDLGSWVSRIDSAVVPEGFVAEKVAALPEIIPLDKRKTQRRPSKILHFALAGGLACVAGILALNTNVRRQILDGILQNDSNSNQAVNPKPQTPLPQPITPSTPAPLPVPAPISTLPTPNAPSPETTVAPQPTRADTPDTEVSEAATEEETFEAEFAIHWTRGGNAKVQCVPCRGGKTWFIASKNLSGKTRQVNLFYKTPRGALYQTSTFLEWPEADEDEKVDELGRLTLELIER